MKRRLPLAQESVSLWATSAAINAELQGLTAVIFSRTSAIKMTVSIAMVPVRGGGHAPGNISAVPFRTLLKGPSAYPPEVGTFTLLAINLDNVPLGGLFQFEGVPADGLGFLPAAGTWGISTRFEGGRRVLVEPDGTSFVDDFEPMAVHVYTWTPPRAQGPTRLR